MWAPNCGERALQGVGKADSATRVTCSSNGQQQYGNASFVPCPALPLHAHITSAHACAAAPRSESANINTSLSVLGRCLEALRHNQALAARGPGGGGAPRVIPVRESSLTSLFKVRGCTSAVAAAAAAAAAATRSCLSAPVANMRLNYDDTGIGVVNLVHLPAQGVLTGQGNLVLSVHLSQHGDEYDTNRHTLRFGALASRLQMAAAAPAAAPPQPPAGLPPLPPSQQQQQQSTQGRAK